MEGHALWPRFPTGFNPAEILDPLDPLRSWWYPRSGSSIGQPGDGPEGPEGPEGTCQARVSNLELHTCDHTLAWFYTGFIRILMMFYGVLEFPQQKDQSQYLINFPKHRLFQRLEKGLGLSSIGLQLLVMETG